MEDLSNGTVVLQVAYLGPTASFSHQASLAVFPLKIPAVLNAVPSFADIFVAVQSSANGTGHSGVSYGVVPFENSSNGSVVQLLDLLADHDERYPDVKVCAEYYLPVHHCLLVSNRPKRSDGGSGVSAFEISKLYTHPQVWGQCSKFLAKHMKGVERIDVSSTSGAAQKVFAEGEAPVAAIASRLAGDVNGLHVVAENIEDEGNNTTRFFVLQNQKGRKFDAPFRDATNRAWKTAKWKSLISFTIAHESPGSLADALAVFKHFQFNLTSIDTRPSRKQPWHYIFFVECEETRASGDEGKVKKMLQNLKQHTESIRYLGSWEDQL